MYQITYLNFLFKINSLIIITWFLSLLFGFLLLLIFISCSFAQNIFQDGLSFWIYTLLYDACYTIWILKEVNRSIKWSTFDLIKLWHSFLDFLFEFRTSLVYWISSDIQIIYFVKPLQILDVLPVGNMVIIDKRANAQTSLRRCYRKEKIQK